MLLRIAVLAALAVAGSSLDLSATTQVCKDRDTGTQGQGQGHKNRDTRTGTQGQEHNDRNTRTGT